MPRPTPVADWEQPFPAEEYAARRRRAAARLSKEGFDAILVTKPADIFYLTGYDMVWFHLRFLTSCILTADGGDVAFFDYPGHRTLVETTPEIRNITWMTRESVQADGGLIRDGALKAGLKGKKLAVQPWSYVPHGDVMAELVGILNSAGIETGDGSLIVEQERLYKSPLEVAVMRRSAEIADIGMTAARDILAPGVMETEIHAELSYAMVKAGASEPALRTMIGSGVRAGTHHSPAQHRRVGQDELVFIDFCASLHRYHVNLNRTFAVGSVDPRWHDLMARSATTIDAIVAEVKPGDMWSKVQDVGNRNTAAQGITEGIWFVGGYTQGIAMPPDWVGEFWVSPRHGIPDLELVPGMVFNMEGQFDDTEGWAGGTGVAYIDTLIVTETGLEVMSRLPRTLETV